MTNNPVLVVTKQRWSAKFSKNGGSKKNFSSSISRIAIWTGYQVHFEQNYIWFCLLGLEGIEVISAIDISKEGIAFKRFGSAQSPQRG
jgi:hypothetical protein